MMGKVQRQHSRSMFQRDDVQTIGVLIRIVQEHHAQNVRLLPDEPEDMIAVALGCAMRGGAPECFFAIATADRPVRNWLYSAGPCPRIAEHVLDDDVQRRKLPERISDSLHARA